MKKFLMVSMTALMLSAQANVMADDVKTPVDSVIVRDIEEAVIISTPKENQYLRQQTLSSTSFSQTEMRTKGVNSIKGVSAMVPNLYIPTYGS